MKRILVMVDACASDIASLIDQVTVQGVVVPIARGQNRLLDYQTQT